jgi:hypothetical protein
MRSELSEFSYGFAITAELRDLFWPWVVEAPVFPTQRNEAQLGWDVRFPVVGRPVFIQFKVAEALTRRSAATEKSGSDGTTRVLCFTAFLSPAGIQWLLPRRDGCE